MKCQKHSDKYIGETGGPLKERNYEHRIIPHKDSKISHSILKKKSIQDVVEDHNGRRRSGRLKKKAGVDYRQLDRGEEIIINPGNSEIAKHMQESTHNKEDVTCEIIQNEDNWYRRGVKEAIEIRRRAPTLNIDKGRYHLSEIWTKVIKQSNEGNALHVHNNSRHRDESQIAEDG